MYCVIISFFKLEAQKMIFKYLNIQYYTNNKELLGIIII